CAIGQGSMGGRCWRNRGKCRISTRTSSLLQSQKLARSSRSSSGVSRSEEKIVVVGSRVATSPCAVERLRRRGFIAVLPNLQEFLVNPGSNGESQPRALPQGGSQTAPAPRGGGKEAGFPSVAYSVCTLTARLRSPASGSNPRAFQARGAGRYELS